MSGRKLKRSLLAMIVLAAAAKCVWALGFRLSQSKEQLELKYNVDCTDHDSGRVSINLTITEQGRIKPVHAVQLAIPSDDGTGYFDLSVSLATETVDGKLRARAHLTRELAERATIRLVTRTNPESGGKAERTWYYHVIPIADYIRKRDQKPK
ncbi:hypothetical protein GC176_04175 [bacterium]|nr:hypothetical protein [bacterium]